jgi:hypothetical protein
MYNNENVAERYPPVDIGRERRRVGEEYIRRALKIPKL